MKSWKMVAAGIASAFLLAGCGGGGGGTASNTPATPATPATTLPAGVSKNAIFYGTVTNNHITTGAALGPQGGMALAGATVVLVKASDVEDFNSLQPVEDLANMAKAKGYPTYLTGKTGVFSFTKSDFNTSNPDTESYYTFVLPPGYSSDPAKDTSLYWPGSCASRQTVSYSGTAVDVGVAADNCDDPQNMVQVTYKNSSPSYNNGAKATYVGSNVCLGCHTGKTDPMHTLHFVGLRVPGSWNSTQTQGGYADNGINEFTSSGNDISFTYKSTTKYAVLSKDANGAYWVQMASSTFATLSPKYNVAFTYGGEGLYKQRYMMLVGPNGGPGVGHVKFGGNGYYYAAPFQFNESNANVTPAAFGADGEAFAQWQTPATSSAAVFYDNGTTAGYGAKERFATDCEGCHGGYETHLNNKGLPVTNYTDPVASDVAAGNMGCEKCHGPGSNHVAQAGHGLNITYPQDLSNGRLTMLCGTCHQRGQGGGILEAGADTSNAGFASFGTLTAKTDITVFKPGMSPDQFYGKTTTVGIAPNFGTSSATAYFDPINTSTDSHSWQDAKYEKANPFVTTLNDGTTTVTQATGYINHSKGHHQQYLDLTRARMWKNDHELVTCIACHDGHDGTIAGQLNLPVDNNALCLDCHNGDDIGQANDNPFEKITGAMVDDLEAGSATYLGNPVIGETIMKHVSDVTDGSIMTGLTYTPANDKSPMGRCITCHMPKTAKSARWVNSLKSGLTSSGNAVFYRQGDIHSHTFDVMTTDAITAMMKANGNDPSKVTPAAVTNKCAVCHSVGGYIP